MKEANMKKIISVILLISLLFNCCSNIVYANDLGDNQNESVGKIYTYVNQGNIRVDGYEDENGNKIFRQYENGILSRRDIVYKDNPEFIYSESVNLIERSHHSIDKIKISDYVTVRQQPEAGFETLASTSTYKGKINYLASTHDNPKIKYSLKCSYKTKVTNYAYTINAYVGPVVTLVSLLVSSLHAPEIFVSQFLNNLVFGVGTIFTSGMIEKALSTTVASKRTKYTWTLTEVGTTRSKNVYGNKYYITQEDSKHYKETFYDGYVPKDWKTQSLGMGLHNEMFSYSNYQILSWTS